MSAVSDSLLRLVASFMLVAMASFVLHGPAMAGGHRHGSGSQGCETRAAHPHPALASSAGEVGAAAHAHADGTAHIHQDHAGAGSPDGAPAEHQAPGAEAACCGSTCTVAITAPAPDAGSAVIEALTALLPGDRHRSGADLDGLKRPPRSTDIA